MGQDTNISLTAAGIHHRVLSSSKSERPVPELSTSVDVVQREDSFCSSDIASVKERNVSQSAFLDKIAPGYSKLIFEINTENKPEANRLYFNQIMSKLEADHKANKIDTETRRHIEFMTMLQMSKLADLPEYKLALKDEQDTKMLEIYHTMMQAKIDSHSKWMDSILRRFDFEKGEAEHVGSNDGSASDLARQDYKNKLALIEAENERIRKSNNALRASADNFSLSLHLMHTKELDVSNLSQVVKDSEARLALRSSAKTVKGSSSGFGLSGAQRDAEIATAVEKFRKDYPASYVDQKAFESLMAAES